MQTMDKETLENKEKKEEKNVIHLYKKTNKTVAN